MSTGKHARDPLTVGKVAERSGVSVSTLHFYEAKGLIESWRTSGNQRRYPRSVLRRVAVIRVAQRAGIPLAVVKNFLDSIPADRAVKKRDWHRLTQAWQAIIDERITSLMQLRNDLESCIGCGCLSLADCPLRNPDDRLASDGPGPRLLEEKADRTAGSETS
ncbi:redox-sensitive transcriptional activator SoxR [Stakelama tenebrarum]|uniref:Redox-sensitive transcriptional activator SoxR n=1 Tax=Stakelama tenebrarum TaxID=2711215 RepID=A0A6G6Y806_9SPHN|nr:redox-sensitive transcriptional activator SoxR [Sphingosinithalassobacter tenebrarum]QIG81074.1 redox-sensitive transcriptional activator SoxR [Sphingosinithalassobacter tenebrarum]